MSDEAKKDEREALKSEPEVEAHVAKGVNDEAADEADDDVEAHVSKSMPSKSMPSKS